MLKRLIAVLLILIMLLPTVAFSEDNDLFISELMVFTTSCDSSEALGYAYSLGYSCINFDLNSGVVAGNTGYSVFLGSRKTPKSEEAITGIIAKAYQTAAEMSEKIIVSDIEYERVNGVNVYSETSTYVGHEGDLNYNWNHTGDYICLYSTKDKRAGKPITALSAGKNDDPAAVAVGDGKNAINLNSNAKGGLPITLYFNTEAAKELNEKYLSEITLATNTAHSYIAMGELIKNGYQILDFGSKSSYIGYKMTTDKAQAITKLAFLKTSFVFTANETISEEIAYSVINQSITETEESFTYLCFSRDKNAGGAISYIECSKTPSAEEVLTVCDFEGSFVSLLGVDNPVYINVKSEKAETGKAKSGLWIIIVILVIIALVLFISYKFVLAKLILLRDYLKGKSGKKREGTE